LERIIIIRRIIFLGGQKVEERPPYPLKWFNPRILNGFNPLNFAPISSLLQNLMGELFKP